jgi:hypothetical protein
MYTIEEGQLTISDDWKDESVNVLTSSKDGKPAFSLVITRDEIAEGMAFSDYVKMEVINISSNLPKFKMLEEKSNYQINEQPAHRIEFAWQSSEGVLHQIVAMTAQQQKALIFTASAPDALTDEQKKQTEEILQSFSFTVDEAG